MFKWIVEPRSKHTHTHLISIIYERIFYMEEQRKQEIVDWGWCTCDG